MVKFYSYLRKRMIKGMQASLKSIREALELSIESMSMLMGISEREFIELENGFRDMNAMQYVAICAVIDNIAAARKDKVYIVSEILAADDTFSDSTTLEYVAGDSFLKKWFLCFPNGKEEKVDYVESVEAQETVSNNFLEELSSDYKIFLDDTCLLTNVIDGDFKALSQRMEAKNNKFLIPYKVIELLQGKIMGSCLEEIEDAKKGLSIIEFMEGNNLADIRGEQDDVNVESTFMSVFAKFKASHRLALITQNQILAEQINLLNNGIIGGYSICLLRFAPNGVLEEWDFSVKEDTEADEEIYYDKEAEDMMDNLEENENIEKKDIGWDVIG